MNLWQLTEKGTQLKGYVDIPMFVETSNGEVVGARLEAYVVPGMTVPVLLGEDFHLTYGISVERDAAFGTTVRFAGLKDAEFKAVGVRRTNDFGKMRKSTAHLASFVKAKIHRRNKKSRQRKRAAIIRDQGLLRLAEDVTIKPHTSVSVKVEGDLHGRPEWYVDKNLIGKSPGDAVIVPNVLISSTFPVLPVANPTSWPRRLRKGEIIGKAEDPQRVLDAARTEEERTRLRQASVLVSELARSTHEASPSGTNPTAPQRQRVFFSEEDGTIHARRTPLKDLVGQGREPDKTTSAPQHDLVSATEDGGGPKTSETPETEEIRSEALEEVLDVGDLPPELRSEALAMLKRRKNAFGFDGRLGHLQTRCRIRTEEGTQPIAVPMYGSSPAKREVINEQLRKWFAQGVIEPSESPWSAPVVIVYCNGKPRFCVDYRKLNAVTVPDEFPIPRQTEILSALSGAQVLSSLDALSGFTQLEMHPDDVEKTAFRTHQGLFQFRRMPFGLRNGPSIFQRTMQSILAPFLWLFALVYIDDIIVYSKSYHEHIDHLDRVLGAIENSGLTLSPQKCHLFYSSVLLLGHKVTQLGLSTHEEKVKVILELKPPTTKAELQMFLGMVVYFSTFIPFYSSIASPLFKLLRKGVPWIWGAEEEYAFRAAKEALQSAPVLGHPKEGKPYRLYTDASDEALGCCLQQVQAIVVRDLKGTRIYEKLRAAYNSGQPIPNLVPKLSAKILDATPNAEWGATFDDSVVHVERVIAYWSRTFKDAETRYSATEREALAAKEGLIRFQPFIEGEEITLVTDHAALQWAKTYENANRRLAAWGAVFSAYAPGLDIVHRPGRIHSNVDPLSRLPRVPPPHISPVPGNAPTIQLNEETASAVERLLEAQPAARFAHVATKAKGRATERAETRSQAKQRAATNGSGGATLIPPLTNATPSAEDLVENARTFEPREPRDPYESRKLWEATHVPPTIHIQMDKDWISKFVDGYKKDASFRDRWDNKEGTAESWYPGARFFKDSDGLLYFKDADFQARLCVPNALQPHFLRISHESPVISAHAGPEKLWEILSQKYYWPRMKKDVLLFCATCDVCQKTKPANFRRYGKLNPHPIPSRPFDSISMDLIVNLPWSNDFNAVLVFVDRLSKMALFIPTTTGLNAQGFAALFVKHIACKFGLPSSIVTDRDPRWTSDFWREVARLLRTEMLLSSSHHPQHDGQTEIVNRQLETMLRAYVSTDRGDWAEWLHLLEHSYNSRPHASTGSLPYMFLYGYKPRSPLDALTDDPKAVSRLSGVQQFLSEMSMHRDDARRAIAKAQVKQADSYNRGRRAEEFEAGDLVLVNPHSLEWVESKGEGAKLVQRWIGPFEVNQRIGENTYRLRLGDNYPGLPIFNLEHLKRYQKSPAEFGTRASMDDTRILKPASEEYEVEKIVGHRYDKKRRTWLYLVRWIGYSPLYDLWLSARDLKNAPEILHEYRRKHKGSM